MINEPCSILISNKNSYEAIQLCIESINRYTRYPDYKVIVYDDGSDNVIDLYYLRQAKYYGWIDELIEGDTSDRLSNPAVGHGGTLNILINEICQTSLAMVIDSDIYVKDYGWLTEMIEKIDLQKDLAICDVIPRGLFTVQGYRVPICDFSFGLLNMAVYNDNMRVDWLPRKADRRDEPFLSIFADIYPPEKSEFFRQKGDKEKFQENQVFFDVGSNLWMKTIYDNPKGYRMIHMPEDTKRKFRHFGHMAFLSRTDEFKDNIKFKNLKDALKELRTQ